MGKCKDPNWATGIRGKHWSRSLKQAQRRGAVVIVEETGVSVMYAPRASSMKAFRPWVDRNGNRYDSCECIPVF